MKLCTVRSTHSVVGNLGFGFRSFKSRPQRLTIGSRASAMDATSHETLQYLFPVTVPSLPPSKLTPVHSAGVSPQSTEALEEVLKDNHVKWHIFFNEARFHNHAPHRSLAAWALGASAEDIKNGYKKDCQYEKPAFKSPGSITWENFNDHLGDDRYFTAYMQFFIAFVQEKGIPTTLEEFVFSRKANLGASQSAPKKQPQMLNRFLGGILHPIIHAGYGAEFGLPGTLAEGLAEAAVETTNPGLLDPLHLFEEQSLLEKMSNISISAPGPDAIQQESAAKVPKDRDLHALTILARVLHDHRFNSKSPSRPFDDVIEAHGQEIASYVDEWDISVKNMEETSIWEKKVEELAWSVVVLYGVAGWVDGKDKPGGFNADFFLMHLVTSSLFLPSLCGLIAAPSRVRLLKAYLHSICIWAIARGQPHLDVKAFMTATKTSETSAPTPKLGVAESTTSGNAWDKILEEARVHKDEHLTKTIRSLAAWRSTFGTKRATSGLEDFEVVSSKLSDEYLPKTELQGSEYLDGSLFLSVAVLTMQKGGNWDFQGFVGQHEEGVEKAKA
ncbi:hypothetical protein CPB83DRAFT_859144 [Crepidotus variabilis]|uniref:Oxidoreductase AflY n=1 Tax=Crepidotus variabilis TaxID=179855 RepID=A0A9P6JMG9_9AGAR|nr:hypothetical protein CPB83DRAFT_859144 [Crepidotus variabilis]